LSTKYWWTYFERISNTQTKPASFRIATWLLTHRDTVRRVL